MGIVKSNAPFAHAWKAKAKEYRAAARFAEGVYRRRESRIRELRTRIELAERIVQIARFWACHDAGLAGALKEWDSQ